MPAPATPAASRARRPARTSAGRSIRRGSATWSRRRPGYGKPIYVTESGIDDASDDKRRAYIRTYLQALQGAIADGADVRGYFYWSLVDNFEWAEGYRAHFGLYRFDPKSLKREMQPSARLYRRIARTGEVPGS